MYTSNKMVAEWVWCSLSTLNMAPPYPETSHMPTQLPGAGLGGGGGGGGLSFMRSVGPPIHCSLIFNFFIF